MGEPRRVGDGRARRQASAALPREKVLAAARHLFMTSGYEDVKAADIAKAAGVAHGLVFHHFGSKLGLYHEVLCQIGREILDLYVNDPDIPLGRRIRQFHAAHLAYLGVDLDRPAIRLAVRLYHTAADQLARDYLTSDHPFDADTVVEMLMTVLAGALRAARTADPEQDVDPVIQALGDVT